MFPTLFRFPDRPRVVDAAAHRRREPVCRVVPPRDVATPQTHEVRVQVLVVHLVPAPHVRGLAAGVRNGRRVFRRTGGRRFRRRLVVGVFVDGQRAAAEDVHHPVEAASRDFRPPRFSKSVRTFCWQSPRRFESRHFHPLIHILGVQFGEFSIRT